VPCTPRLVQPHIRFRRKQVAAGRGNWDVTTSLTAHTLFILVDTTVGYGDCDWEKGISFLNLFAARFSASLMPCLIPLLMDSLLEVDWFLMARKVYWQCYPAIDDGGKVDWMSVAHDCVASQLS